MSDEASRSLLENVGKTCMLNWKRLMPAIDVGASCPNSTVENSPLEQFERLHNVSAIPS
jgi:hypothetical protein